MYSSLIEKLCSSEYFGMKLGLKNMHLLDKLFGFPSKKFKSIHIAGTNGKGSVSTKISSALKLSGYKVGLYTSPHIENFSERIKINDIEIGKEEIEKYLSPIFDIIKINEIKATFFEIVTILAFIYFAQKKIDFAVIETGLGGRFDATNIISPILTVITSISLDHCDKLGDTLNKIAFEKAGIIKENVPLVIGYKAVLDPILTIAQKKKSQVIISENDKGSYDEQNSTLSRDALVFLKFKFKEIKISDNSISIALKKKPMCRFEEVVYKKNNGERIYFPVKIIIDAAHNIDAFIELFKAIQKKYPEKKIDLIFSMSKEKDLEQILKYIYINTNSNYFFEFQHPRLISINEFKKYSESKFFEIHADVDVLMKKAIDKASQNDSILLVAGSFYFLSEIKKYLKFHLDH